MRESKIQYNPSLSVEENARKNSVTPAAVRYYIKTNLLDRRYERKLNIIEDCRKYLNNHPEATRAEISKKTGHSLSTIRKYWQFITTEEELTDFDRNKTKKKLLRQNNDFYATHPSVAQDILREETFSEFILEPFCGSGTMAEVIRQNGHKIVAYDIIDRGYGGVGDFFKVDYPKGQYDIISNPPYNKTLKDIIIRCLYLAKNKVALLLTLNYLTGKERYKEIFSVNPPARVYVYTERIDVARNADFDKYAGLGSNLTNYAWFVWDKSYKGKPELKWIQNIK